MNHAQANDIISASPLWRAADVLIPNLRQAIRLQAQRTERNLLRTGASRIGGHPDVPSDFAWPRWMGSRHVWSPLQRRARTPSTDTALDFVAQIRLENLPSFSSRGLLPPSGMLYFFYDFENQPWGFDPADFGGWRVIYLDISNEDLRPFEWDNPNPALHSAPCRVEFSSEWTLPNNYSQWDEIDKTRDMGKDWYDQYEQLLSALAERSIDEREPVHRLLGQPMPVQNDMELECQLVSNGLYCGDPSGYEDARSIELAKGAKDWMLLLQIDTDEENPGWMWGDAGRIYYWIRKEDLARQRFDRTWFILQCG